MRWVRCVLGIMLVVELLVGCIGKPAPASATARIEGALSDGGRPLAGARVTLTAYADDTCADLADAGPSTQAERGTDWPPVSATRAR